jgi:hypothetical protein
MRHRTVNHAPPVTHPKVGDRINSVSQIGDHLGHAEARRHGIGHGCALDSRSRKSWEHPVGMSKHGRPVSESRKLKPEPRIKREISPLPGRSSYPRRPARQPLVAAPHAPPPTGGNCRLASTRSRSALASSPEGHQAGSHTLDPRARDSRSTPVPGPASPCFSAVASGPDLGYNAAGAPGAAAHQP